MSESDRALLSSNRQENSHIEVQCSSGPLGQKRNFSPWREFRRIAKKERKERNVDVKENVGWMGPCTVKGENCMA